jgi:signal transduction histidine kinase
VDNARLFEEAERAGRARSDFLAVMSHELRTPLNAVLGYAGLLGDGITGPVTEAQRAQLGRIQASARHLLLLVDEVLTLARLEAGTQQVRPEPLDLFTLVQETVQMVEPTTAMRGLRLELDGPPAPIAVTTDATKLRQVLLNLLSNAVKFTPPGGSVTVSLARGGAGDLLLRVADTGIGIRAEDIPRAFEAFTQLDGALSRRFQGSGLGLYLSRALAAAQGAELALESAPGAGTTAVLRFPKERLVAPSVAA